MEVNQPINVPASGEQSADNSIPKHQDADIRIRSNENICDLQSSTDIPLLPAWCNVYEGLTDEEVAEIGSIALLRAKLSRVNVKKASEAYMPKLTLCSFAPRNLDELLAEAQSAQTGAFLETTLRTLVRIRVSQIAGCAYGIDHFWKEGADAGEDLRRLNALIVLPSILERRPSYHDFHYFF